MVSEGRRPRRPQRTRRARREVRERPGRSAELRQSSRILSTGGRSRISAWDRTPGAPLRGRQWRAERSREAPEVYSKLATQKHPQGEKDLKQPNATGGSTTIPLRPPP